MSSSRSEQIAQVVISSLSGALSVMGSSVILYRLIALKKSPAFDTTRPVFRRLMIALSGFDIYVTLWLIFGFLAVPSETGNWGAVGNQTSCEVAGFMTHLLWVTISYNVSLMIYYVFSIRYEWSDARLSKCVEPCFHVFSIVLPVAEGAAAYALDLFNPAGRPSFGWCRMTPYPTGCEVDDSCERGEDYAKLFRLLFVKVPAILFYVALHACVFLIYWTLRQRTSTPRQGQGQGRQHRRHSDTSNSNRAVMVQSLIYCTIFFWTYLFSVVALVFEQIYDGMMTDPPGPTERQTRALLGIRILAFNVLLPLQGFFVFLNFVRPRYNQARLTASIMSKSTRWVLHQTILGTLSIHQMRMQARQFSMLNPEEQRQRQQRQSWNNNNKPSAITGTDQDHGSSATVPVSDGCSSSRPSQSHHLIEVTEEDAGIGIGTDIDMSTPSNASNHIQQQQLDDNVVMDPSSSSSSSSVKADNETEPEGVDSDIEG